jgi:hypothetical protein
MARVIISILFSLAVISGIYSQKKIYTTARITTDPPHIDGIIDEEAWDAVEWDGDFIQRIPYEKNPPSQQTAFKIIYDDENLYVGIRCFDTSPDSIVKRMSRRDGFDGDWIEINIDSYHDLRTAFSFTVNAAGVKGDEAITNDINWDTSWDPIWYVKTGIDSLGWTAEMRIPLTQLRFSLQEEYIWGLQFTRRLYRKEEISNWQFISPNASGWVHNFGELHGIRNIRPQKQKDIVPYVVSRYEHYEKEEGNPFADGRDFIATAGIDGKIGVTNNLTLDFTVNPDFGQVEADPSEVNLTTFETKFKDKRPFFIEGSDILSYDFLPEGSHLSNDNLFYSRRIGRPPARELDLPDSAYEETIKSTTILGALKLTGKTRSGWSIGLLESFTQKEVAEVEEYGQRRKEEMEPFTNYFAARVQKEMNNSNTRLGAMVTAANRDLSDPELDTIMNRTAYTGGINFNHQWKDKTYYFDVMAGFSHLRGNEKAIYEIQTSAPHFFQRTDASHLKADSTLTSLNGFGGTIQYGRAGNSKLQYIALLTWRSPGFHLNDIGYLHNDDEIQEVAWIGYFQHEPFSIFRSLNLNIAQWYGLTFGGERRYIGGSFDAYCDFKNFWELGAGVARGGKFIQTEELRGGPSLLNDGDTQIASYLETDHRKKIRFSFNNIIYILDHNTAFGEYYSIGMTVQISDALNFSVAPTWQKSNNKIAYVDNVDYMEGQRYVRGNINRTQTSVVVRLNYNISPDFTVQYYGMPFIAAGKYCELKYISDSKADDINDRYVHYTEGQIELDGINNIYNIDENNDGTIDYSFYNPDFNHFDFNSNLVIRWEYLPGSTLYLVWSQNRFDERTDGRFSLMNDIKELFRIYPYDIFLIKLSYRFAL